MTREGVGESKDMVHSRLRKTIVSQLSHRFKRLFGVLQWVF